MNGKFIHDKIAHPKGRIKQWLNKGTQNEKIITELYMLALSRMPTRKEREAINDYLADKPTRDEGLADLMWAVMNMNEFLFQH